MALSFLAALLMSAVSVGDGSRILAFLPNTAKSHHITMEPLFTELAARGHQVTLFSCFPHDPPVPNLQDVNICSGVPSAVSNLTFETVRESMTGPFKTPIFMSKIEHHFCDLMYQEEPIQKLLSSEEKVDLVMAETFANDCFAPFAKRFKAPLVSFVTSSALPWVSDRVGLPDNPSYIPNYLMPLSTRMDFFQRLYNAVVLTYAKALHRFYTVQNTQDLVNKYFGGSAPDMHDVLKNTSLLLVNGHFSISLSRPFPPNVVEIGGIHIKKSIPLPNDLKSILDKSTQGVILVSFGTMLRTSSFPPELIQMLLKVFAKFPQTVIIKYEIDLPAAPPNVVIRKWVPQKEILEHKHVKILIGHGGLASTIEAVHVGKPVLGIPFFADQYVNLKALERKGAGIVLDLENISEEKATLALKNILHNPSYAQNMQQLSLQFRDRPLDALQSAVYWTEYVIRHQGAAHLQPASVHLPFYQYLLLDVLAVMLLPVVILMYIIYFLFFRAVEVSPNDYRNYIKPKLKKDE